jgi:hypothetical protein
MNGVNIRVVDVVVFCFCGGVAAGFWWWITRRVDHRDSVSQEWRDAHGRDQGTKGGFR